MHRDNILTSINNNNTVKVRDDNNISQLYILDKTAAHLLQKHDSTAFSIGGFVSSSALKDRSLK